MIELFKAFIIFEKRRMEECEIGLKDFILFFSVIIMFCIICRFIGVEQ